MFLLCFICFNIFRICFRYRWNSRGAFIKRTTNNNNNNNRKLYKSLRVWQMANGNGCRTVLLKQLTQQKLCSSHHKTDNQVNYTMRSCLEMMILVDTLWLAIDLVIEWHSNGIFNSCGWHDCSYQSWLKRFTLAPNSARSIYVCVHGRLSRLPNISTHMIVTTSLDGGAIQRAAHFSNVEPWIGRAAIDFQI